MRSVIEDLMRDIIFDLSGKAMKGMKVVVDKDQVLALKDRTVAPGTVRLEPMEETSEDPGASPQIESQPDPDAETSSGETAA